MFDGRAMRERKLIQMECADGMPKSACDIMNWLIEVGAAHPGLFGFKPERPCLEKVLCGHKILGMFFTYSGGPSYGRPITPVQPVMGVPTRSRPFRDDKPVEHLPRISCTLRIDFLLVPQYPLSLSNRRS